MEEYKDLIVGIIAFFAGIWCIYASVKNKNSFFNSISAWIVIAMFRRNGARIFYGIFGLGMIALSIKILYDYFSK